MIYALMTVLALLWGLSFLGTKVVLGILTPVEVLAVRWMLAFLLFSLLILFKIIKVDYKGKDLKPLMIAAAIFSCALALLLAAIVYRRTSGRPSRDKGES